MKRNLLARIATSAAVATAMLGGATLSGSPAHAVPVGAAAGEYVPLSPQRVLDTRKGAFSGFTGLGTLGPHARGSINLAGASGLPASGPQGGTVLLNVTVTNATRSGYLTITEGTPSGLPSTINFTAHITTAGLVAMAYGTGTAGLDVYNESSGSVDVIADVEGYYVGDIATAPGRFTAVGPWRLYDSRRSAALTAGSTRVVTMTGIPADGAAAALVDLIAVAPARGGYLAAYADGGRRPSTSNLDFAAGQIKSGMAIVPIGSDGKIDIFNGSGGATNVVVDVFGYYLAGTPSDPGAEDIIPASRLLDTRTGNGAPRGAVADGHSVTLQVLGRGGVPPTGVSTVALNVVATGSTQPGFLTIRADGAAPNGTSLLNYPAGATVSNLVIAPVGADGKVVLTVFGSGSVNLIADVQAYSLPATVLSGRVTDQAGHPVSVSVGAYTADYSQLWSTQTDSQGRFIIGGVDGVSLTLCYGEDVVYPSTFAGSVADQCWQGAGLGQPSTPIVVPSGTTFTADAALPPGGAVTGTVTDPAGNPIQSQESLKTGSWHGGQGGGAPGSYFIGGLSTGTYTMCFWAPVQSGAPYGYVPKCYDDQPTGSPTPFDVTGGKITSGINAVLDPAGAVAGNVDIATANGTPAHALFYVMLAGPSPSQQLFGNSTGSYTISELEPGSYTLCIKTNYRYAVPACYGGTPASPVTVSALSLTGGLDVHLAGAGEVDGMVKDATGTGLAGATVTATSAGGTFTVQTDAEGGYRLTQVPPGQYTVCFHADGHTDQCYDGAADSSSATPVTVTMDATTPGISATLN